MVDLFEEWFIFCFLFIYVGVDCFGFWDVVMCWICGGFVNFKWWVVLFVCLLCCGVYIEVIEEMIILLFINVLCCFIFIRGKVKEFYLDRGINFIGGICEFGINVVFVEDFLIKFFL